MSRKKVDLRTLPAWLYYIVALVVTVAIMIVAWIVGRDRPIPDWIENYLIPSLGWVFLLFLAVAIIGWLLKKR